MKILITEEQFSIIQEYEEEDLIRQIDKLMSAFKNNSSKLNVSKNTPINTNQAQTTSTNDFNRSEKITFLTPLKNNVRIMSHFGEIRTNNGKQSTHKGIDFSVPSNTPIYSPLDGVVEFAGDTSPNPCGGLVKIKHGDYTTKYCHIKKWVVSKNQRVNKGDLIAYSGGGINDEFSGRSTGPHLHYEILADNNQPINPLDVHHDLS